ncbi:MAG TPA: hypothetical protein VL173_17840 [Vicinamibacterales bacterium]|jgi:hypothetical protein|nr:hypothetical protein [Vicinamibacterales bacterium]
MSAPLPGQFGVLSRDVEVRIVNCSASGCLMMASTPMAVGTTGSLRIAVEGLEAIDAVQVVRCQAIEGAGHVYHIGARFLWTAPPRLDSIRHVVPRLAANPAGATAVLSPS